ncbi:probable nucleoredoxin 1 [Daucus carota subsp. sativus]|uniref:probable nucleoredoxin 1 n=1 Tax=Daucus carota subsp. sativus TaxID=79200 RepID=UPI0007EFEA6C|nr:PREDICTED: probable nucleoredoxin 1 [Daucus carota subsp. sativus]
MVALFSNVRVLVKAKDLQGKVVVLLFMSLINGFGSGKIVITNLLDIYTKLHLTGAFEIVFVIVRDADFSQYFKQIPTTAHKHFLQTFPSMPWPAIPLSDRKTRKRLETFFAISGDVRTSPRSIIIDPTGVVLHCDATPLFLRYGAAAFPFTSDRIQFLDSEDDVIKKQPPSVKELLASSERDFLINNKGEQVPLHDLDKKVVGLYFSPCLKLQNFTRKLKMIYEELSGNMENFEIVLIYVHGWFEDYYGRTGEASFLHAFRTMPWLAVPFDDTNFIKGLQRLFQYPQELGSKPDYRLMIIGPHGNFMEPWGGNISLLYGVPAYPFNTCSAANLELERIKDLKLEML